ncbi:ComEA family DNA-binding protein [Candidatus Pacearchaeota archaeon]|nr:ComEA family DNA-binding protein [Candidatus Pacearchaeota archaeon]
MFNQDNKYLSLISSRKSIIVLVIILAGIFCIVIGIVSLTQSQSGEEEPVLIESNSITQEKIIVEVAGAVKRPGVYSLSLGDRVSDLIKKSGGISEDANIEEMAKSLNLAKKLTDSEKVYVSFRSEGESTTDFSGQISINSATQSQLESLEGVGEKRALEIILQRPYSSIDELLTKEVLSQSVYEKNENMLML